MIWTESTSASMVLVWACRVAIGFAGLHWLWNGDGLQLGIACASLALSILPGRLIREERLNNAASVVAALLLSAHVVLGMLGSMYETSLLYDKAIHALGSGALAALLVMAIRTYCHRRLIELPMALFAILVIGGTVSAGTVWELFEYAVDSTGAFNAQRGLDDTMLDLLANACGTVTILSVAIVTGRQGDHHADSK